MNFYTIALWYETLRTHDSLKEIVDFPSLQSGMTGKLEDNCKFVSNYLNNFPKRSTDDVLSKIGSLPINLQDNIKLGVLDLSEQYKKAIAFLTISLIDLFLLSDYSSEKVESYDQLDNIFGKYVVNSTDNIVYWRGQTHSNYGLIPSIFRNLNKNQWFEKEDVFKLYEDEGLITKYKSVFDHVQLQALNNSINMKFFAYMQHSTSFSPLLDATERIEIATIFANHFYEGTNFNDYRNSDSALFAFDSSVLKKFQDDDLVDFSIQYIHKKITPKTQLFGKYLWECKLVDLATHYYLYDAKSNDRMKYQHGLFAFPYHGVIVGNKLLNVLDRTKIHKIIISKDCKQEIYKRIVKDNPQFDYDYLMNPYLYFGIK